MNHKRFTLRALPGFFCGALLAVAAAAALAAGSPGDARDLQAVANFKLNDRVLDRYTAVVRNFITLKKEHPDVVRSLEQEGDNRGGEETIAEMVDWIDRQAPVRDAITSAGMSVRDYALCSFAMIQTALYAYAVRAGGDAGWKDVPAGVPSDNVRYYLANKAKFDAIDRLNEQLNGAGDGGND